MESIKYDFVDALLSIDRIKAVAIFNKATSESTPLKFIEETICDSLEEIGKGWEEGRYSLSQIYMSGKICEEIVDSVFTHQIMHRTSQPKTAIAVLEDYHLLGKRIVYSMLRAYGYEIIDYGNISVEQLIKRVNEDEIEILFISTLMLPSALRIKDVVLNLQNKGIKIIVGGAPFRLDDNLWKEVNADEYGKTASDVIRIMNKIVGGNNEQ